MTDKPLLNTSQRIQHVYICNGTPQHVHTGIAITRHGKFECPTCKAEIRDATDDPIGKAFFAFTRTDLGDTTK